MSAALREGWKLGALAAISFMMCLATLILFIDTQTAGEFSRRGRVVTMAKDPEVFMGHLAVLGIAGLIFFWLGLLMAFNIGQTVRGERILTRRLERDNALDRSVRRQLSDAD